MSEEGDRRRRRANGSGSGSEDEEAKPGSPEANGATSPNEDPVRTHKRFIFAKVTPIDPNAVTMAAAGTSL